MGDAQDFSRSHARSAGDLVVRARAELAAGNWMNALDLASQALAEDPSLTEAAELVGAARRGLGSVSAAGVELRQLTVIAVDMVRSTALAAAAGPEAWRDLMMELYGLCADAVTRYEGRVTKYVGDGVLAHFGHPIAHEDDARRATLAAFSVLEGVELLAARWEERFGERVVVRIGIDVGTVAIGPVEASPWSTDEISGDAPNIASRVQATAEPMTVRVTDAVQGLIGGWFETEPVGEVDLRNYPRPIGLHRVLRQTEAESRLEASMRPRPPLVNREPELEVLLDAWNHVHTTGERRIITITGEAGIGKSRLVEHVLATAVAAGAYPITLACSPLQRDSPFRPVIRALRRRFHVGAANAGGDEVVVNAIRRQLELLPNRRAPIEQAVPTCAWLLGVRSAVDLEPDALRRQLFDAVIDLFEALAITAPIVLYVDDVDAADPSTVELLEALLARPSSPMLVVLTGRGPLPSVGEVDTALQITGLEPHHAAELARAVGPSLPGDTVQRIVERCDGLPFYVEELSRAADETRAEVGPETVEMSAFVSARLDELGPDLRRLVEQIAIAGHEVRVDVLERLAGGDPGVLRGQLGQLVSRSVVRRSRGPAGEAVRFRHGVLREVAYATLMGTRRRALHARLAGILAAMPAGSVRPEDLAGHHGLAEDHGNAARCWLEAGRAAADSGSNREAAQLFGYCLTELDHLPAAPERMGAELEAQLGRGAALLTIEGYTSPDARAAFERAATLAEGFGTSTAIFPALWGIWSYWFVLGEHEVADGLAQRCSAVAEASDDPWFRYAAATIVGYQRLYMGDIAAARDALEIGARGLGLPPAADLPHDMAVASQSALAVALLRLGERDAAATAARVAWEQAQAIDPSERRAGQTLSWTANWMAWHAELAGDPETALHWAEIATEVAGQNLAATWMAAAALHRSIALCSLGRYEEGLPVLTAMVDAWQSAGRDRTGQQVHPVLMTSYYAGRLAEALLNTGGAERAARWVDDLLATTASNGEGFWDEELRALRDQLAAAGHSPQRSH